MERVRLAPAVAAEIRRHALASPKEEVCGLISADTFGRQHCYPVTNIAPDKSHYFEMDARALIDAMRAMRESGALLTGIYHSHPLSAAVPSPADIERYEYPDALYIIVSLASRVPAVRGFYIRDRLVTEVIIESDNGHAPRHL